MSSILIPILLYFYLSRNLNAGLLLVTEYFYTVTFIFLLKCKIWVLVPPLDKYHKENLVKNRLYSFCVFMQVKPKQTHQISTHIMIKALTVFTLFCRRRAPEGKLSEMRKTWLLIWAHHSDTTWNKMCEVISQQISNKTTHYSVFLVFLVCYCYFLYFMNTHKCVLI